ncbi:MAG: hypothetical protein IIC76_16075 [Bacteroidetes bacterium]|nr:hypothetical protein [Bacteroidota bacterium]
MIYLVIAFSTLLFTIFITPYFIKYLNKIRIVDTPEDERRIHSYPVPRLGGLIVYIITMVSISVFFRDLNTLKIFIAASFVIFSLGIIDDIVGINWKYKFIVQFFCAFLLFYFLNPYYNSVILFGYTLPGFIGLLVLVVFIVGAMNSFNLLDGLDGLVSGLSLMVIFVTFLVGFKTGNFFLMVLSASLVGVLLGFLRFNAFPAKIFLGDCGSLTLGLFVITAGMLSAISVNGENTLDFSFVLILLAVPILDTVRVMIMRLIHKRNPFLPDKSHIHHIILGKNIRHKTAVFVIESYALIFTVISIYYLFYSKFAAFIIFVLFGIMYLFTGQILDLIISKSNSIIYGRILRLFPQVIIKFYKSYFIPLVSISIFGLMLYLTLRSSVGDNNLLYVTLILFFILIIYSIINYKINKGITHLIFFINTVTFFLLVGEIDINFKVIDMPYFSNFDIHKLITLMLLPTIAFFLVFRERIHPNGETFLSGIDLIVTVFISLAFISSNLIPVQFAGIISTAVFSSFLIYLFYKILVRLQPKFQIPIFTVSFLLVAISQTLLLLS